MIYYVPNFNKIKNSYPHLLDKFGYLCSLAGNMNVGAINEGYRWIFDNGAFSKKFIFKDSIWYRALYKYKDFASTCTGVVIPDVVGNWQETCERFYRYYHIPKELGYKIFFVTQDGVSETDIPWDLIDGIFVGGSNNHRYTDGIYFCAVARYRYGKIAHVGRVNSKETMKRVYVADSCDGTRVLYPDSKGIDIVEDLAKTSKQLVALKTFTDII